MGDETGIKLRGSAEWEVNGATEKIDGLASIMDRCALSCNYASSPRVLLGAAAPVGEVLGMQVPVAYHDNAKTRKWEPVEQLCNPPCPLVALNDDPEKIRAWADFCFLATGSSNASSKVPSTIHPR
ncbi:hypothetical protein N7494_004794 [Penicillium frequentans]|uniref:Uncharacterized protein n=1 Tax=Penicillium frequentans TaxID=3151616 RepID=A0AAD6D2F0_9EURO|nr:hypothetical protein N7494_004794 [Penicillium glabrum]